MTPGSLAAVTSGAASVVATGAAIGTRSGTAIGAASNSAIGATTGGAGLVGAVAGTTGSTVLLPLFLHFLTLSLLSIGGAVSTAPEMHRLFVTEHHWLSDADFAASLALAQAAPGPNVLFVAVLGWKIAGWSGVLAAMTGMLLPSTVLSLAATRWAARRRDTLAVRAFTVGMAPLTLGLLLATAWLLAGPASARAGGWLLAGVAAFAIARTRVSPLWLVAAGAVVGVLGWC